MKRVSIVQRGRIGIWVTGTLVVGLAVGVAVPARAALRLLDFTGTLTFEISTLSSATGAGGAVAPAITSGGHLVTLALPGGFAPITTSVPMTNNVTINSVVFTGVGNLSATIAGISGGPPLGSRVMGMQGLVKVCLTFSECRYASVPVPLTPTPGGAGMGIGGTQTLPGAVALTLQHAAWTIGQPTMTIHSANSNVTAPTLPGGFAGPPSATARNSGVLQLVTASKVFTSLESAFPELPMFAIMNLHIVPEPGTLLLFSMGVAGIGFYGNRRRKL